jgi:hypothetical protein
LQTLGARLFRHLLPFECGALMRCSPCQPKCALLPFEHRRTCVCMCCLYVLIQVVCNSRECVASTVYGVGKCRYGASTSQVYGVGKCRYGASTSQVYGVGKCRYGASTSQVCNNGVRDEARGRQGTNTHTGVLTCSGALRQTGESGEIEAARGKHCYGL